MLAENTTEKGVDIRYWVKIRLITQKKYYHKKNTHISCYLDVSCKYAQNPLVSLEHITT